MESSKLRECPYNRSHMIMQYKMAVHLNRCRRNYPNIVKKICIFDASHHINEPEFEFHLETCPSRLGFDQYRYTMQPGVSEIIQEIPPVHLPEPTEDWDSEVREPTYNPKDEISRKTVLSKLSGAIPSQRKAYRFEQRRKFASEMSGGKIKKPEPEGMMDRLSNPDSDSGSN